MQRGVLVASLVYNSLTVVSLVKLAFASIGRNEFSLILIGVSGIAGAWIFSYVGERYRLWSEYDRHTRVSGSSDILSPYDLNLLNLQSDLIAKKLNALLSEQIANNTKLVEEDLIVRIPVKEPAPIP
jgi:hypothetical protein